MNLKLRSLMLVAVGLMAGCGFKAVHVDEEAALTVSRKLLSQLFVKGFPGPGSEVFMEEDRERMVPVLENIRKAVLEKHGPPISFKATHFRYVMDAPVPAIEFLYEAEHKKAVLYFRVLAVEYKAKYYSGGVFGREESYATDAYNPIAKLRAEIRDGGLLEFPATGAAKQAN